MSKRKKGDWHKSIESHWQRSIGSCSKTKEIVSKEAGKRHHVEPGNYINDNVVDFWMCWIQRKELPNKSLVHIFSHFFTKLANGGYDAIAHWTTNRGINMFQKKLILIPVNIHKHWSLCAVINHCFWSNKNAFGSFSSTCADIVRFFEATFN